MKVVEVKGHPGNVVCGSEAIGRGTRLPHGLGPTDRADVDTSSRIPELPWSILGEGLLPLVATLDATIGRCVPEIQPDGLEPARLGDSWPEVVADTEHRTGECLVRRRGDLCRLDAGTR
jgi:hypothetical protein